MDKNIDKDKFNRNWQLYMDNKDPQVDNWLYCKYLHEDIKAIIHNCLYHFDFPDPRLTFKDVEADLLVHLQYKKEVLRKYKGNWYNIVFTMMKRKLYDILRSYRDENESLGKLHDFCNHNLDTIEINNITHDLEEEPEQPKQQQEEVPEVLPVQRVEAVQVTEVAGRKIPVQIMQSRRKTKPHKSSRRPHNSFSGGLQLMLGF